MQAVKPAVDMFIGLFIYLVFVHLIGRERNKIRCGKLNFRAVSEQIRFDWVNSYEDFRRKFGVAESE